MMVKIMNVLMILIQNYNKELFYIQVVFKKYSYLVQLVVIIHTNTTYFAKRKQQQAI